MTMRWCARTVELRPRDDDDGFGPGQIRDDGPKLTPAYLLEVKQPSESRGSRRVGGVECVQLSGTTPADEVFRAGRRSCEGVLRIVAAHMREPSLLRG